MAGSNGLIPVPGPGPMPTPEESGEMSTGERTAWVIRAAAALLSESSAMLGDLAGPFAIEAGHAVQLQGARFNIAITPAGETVDPLPGGARLDVDQLQAYLDEIDPSDRQPGEPILVRIKRIVAFLQD